MLNMSVTWKVLFFPIQSKFKIWLWLLCACSRVIAVTLVSLVSLKVIFFKVEIKTTFTLRGRRLLKLVHYYKDSKCLSLFIIIPIELVLVVLKVQRLFINQQTLLLMQDGELVSISLIWTQITSRLSKLLTTTGCKLYQLRLEASWSFALWLHFQNQRFKIAVKMADEYFCILVGMWI